MKEADAPAPRNASPRVAAPRVRSRAAPGGDPSDDSPWSQYDDAEYMRQEALAQCAEDQRERAARAYGPSVRGAPSAPPSEASSDDSPWGQHDDAHQHLEEAAQDDEERQREAAARDYSGRKRTPRSGAGPSP